MFGKPLLINNNNDKLILKTPDQLIEKIIFCSVLNIVFLLGYTFMAITADGNDVLIRLSKLFSLFMILAIIFDIFYCFAFRTKYIFDYKLKEVYQEDSFFILAFKKLICSFSDIRFLNIRYNIEEAEHLNKSDLFNIKFYKTGETGVRTCHVYYLELFTNKTQPTDIIELTNTKGKYFALNLNDLREIAKTLSQTTGCLFKKGFNNS